MNCLKNITDADVATALRGARERVVFLAPGISDETASALAETWQRLGPEGVSVVLDVDPEVVRLGYGTLKGLEIIREAAAAMGQAIGHQPGVRICVVVTDDATLILTPTPLLIEAGSTQPDRPNGISLATTPPVLAGELGAGEEGQASRQIGLTMVNAKQIEAVKKNLHDNPPLKFDISRKERFFNAKLEFVEFELGGCFVSRHTVTIPPELVGMAKMEKKTRDKLRSSFRLVEESDILDAKKKISERTLRDECQRIRKKFLRSIARYGTLILRSNKDGFEKEVAALREMVEAFRIALREKLNGIYAANAKRLTKALLPSVAKHPPEDWIGVLGLAPERKAIEQMLHQTLLRSFGDPEALLKEMRVNLNFKGVTYGTLVDPDFLMAAGVVFPNLKLVEEFDAARGTAAPPPEQRELKMS
jgi:hypothetical protein